MRKHLLTSAAALMVVGSLVACQRTDAPTRPDGEASASSAPASAETAACRGGATIVDIAASDSRFEYLVTAVQAADLADALDGPEHVTVFAPTDQAFMNAASALGFEDVSGLVSYLQDNDALKTVLLYHVTGGDRPSQSVVNADRLRMKSGGFVSVDGTTLTDAAGRTSSIVQADVKACNGYVHAIDSVLLPFMP